MADVHSDSRYLRSPRIDPRRRVVVVGKAEKEERDRRRRSRRDGDERDVPDVDDLRRSRTEYYSRPQSERYASRYRPLDQEMSSRDDRVKRTGSTRLKEVGRSSSTRDAGGWVRPAKKGTVIEDDYVYKDAPIRKKSVRGGDEVREYRRDDYDYARERQYSRGATSERQRPRTPEDVYPPAAPSPPGQGSPQKSSKISRGSTRIGTGSNRTRSSTIRSRSGSRSRSRRGGSTKGRSVKVRARPPMPSLPEDHIPASMPAKDRRRTSFLGGFFAGRGKLESTRTVECLTCASEVSSDKAAVLDCGHIMCHRCLKRIFTMSVTDPQHMPPRCCASDNIPLKYVAKLFDDRFKMRWNRKFEEYTTQNRLYCPGRGCGAWIPPQEMRPSRIDPKRSIGICRRCETRTCGKCGRKWHTNSDCDKLERDDNAREFVKMAAASGWQRCYNCTATVELKEGCNHMTCRCGAEFCMNCGSKWKGCDCPWFNPAQLQDGDRLDMPADLGRNRRGYAADQAQRRDQERRDEEVARRMQGLEIDDYQEDRTRPRSPTVERNWGGNDTYGYGNQAGHFMNDNFVQRATRILTGAFNNENRDAANRLVHEIRSDRAPPLPRGAVIDPVRTQRSQGYDERDRERSRDGRSRPGSRRVVTATEVADNAGIPRRASTRRRKDPPPPEGSATRNDYDDRRRSILAGLATRPGESRVEQWRNNVREGPPEAGPA